MGVSDMAAEYFDDGWSVGDGFTNWEPGLKGYESGLCATPHGFVDIFIQGDDKHRNHTTLRFIHDGRVWMRSYSYRFTRHGAASKAKQFAREIAR